MDDGSLLVFSLLNKGLGEKMEHLVGSKCRDCHQQEAGQEEEGSCRFMF
jgi:hypothetical protein